MIVGSLDMMEYRGKNTFKSREGVEYTKYMFDDEDGERYEFFGRDVEGESLLEKGKMVTVILFISNRTGKGSLYGVQEG